MIKLENWSVVVEENRYLPPESQGKCIKGTRPDGKRIRTSPIQSAEGRIIQTQNSEYELGEVKPEFLEWCKKNGHHLPIGDNPIRMKA